MEWLQEGFRLEHGSTIGVILLGSTLEVLAWLLAYGHPLSWACLSPSPLSPTTTTGITRKPPRRYTRSCAGEIVQLRATASARDERTTMVWLYSRG
jgi:hypothetical protein